MNFEDLKKIFLERQRNNPRAFEEIADIFGELEAAYKEDAAARKKNPEQAWHSWKGHNYEKLVFLGLQPIIEKELPTLSVILGKEIERRVTNEELSRVKRSLLVDFGCHGNFLPDVDIVVYSKTDLSAKAIISCKTSLRERIAQTGYWKLKLKENPITRPVKMFFATSDDDEIFLDDDSGKMKKSKAIAMHDLDAVYVLRQGVEERYNVKALDKIIEDLK